MHISTIRDLRKFVDTLPSDLNEDEQIIFSHTGYPVAFEIKNENDFPVNWLIPQRFIQITDLD